MFFLNYLIVIKYNPNDLFFRPTDNRTGPKHQNTSLTKPTASNSEDEKDPVTLRADVKRLELVVRGKDRKIEELENAASIHSNPWEPKEGMKAQNKDLIEKNKSLNENLKNSREEIKEMRTKLNMYEAKYIRLSSKIGTGELRGRIKMTIPELVDDMPGELSEIYLQLEDKNFPEEHSIVQLWSD